MSNLDPPQISPCMAAFQNESSEHSKILSLQNRRVIGSSEYLKLKDFMKLKAGKVEDKRMFENSPAQKFQDDMNCWDYLTEGITQVTSPTGKEMWH